MTLTDRMERGHLQPATALLLKPAHMILAALALLIMMTGCAFATSTPVVATLEPTTGPTITPVIATPSAIATRQLATTPESAAVTVEAVRQALRANDAMTFMSLLLRRVLMAHGPEGEMGEMVERDAALAWLNTRWGATREIVSTQYIEHFMLLEIRTTGWLNLPPLTGGIVLFHLHRFNLDGQADPLRGSWRIDSILYQ